MTPYIPYAELRSQSGESGVLAFEITEIQDAAKDRKFVSLEAQEHTQIKTLWLGQARFLPAQCEANQKTNRKSPANNHPVALLGLKRQVSRYPKAEAFLIGSPVLPHSLAAMMIAGIAPICPLLPRLPRALY
jgi:hypothetical protein